MKEQEARELNGDVVPDAEESVVKPAEEANGGEQVGTSDATAEDQDVMPPSSLPGEGRDGEGTTDNSIQNKESLPCDSAQGALGQVKAKVEVCKDESIGKSLPTLAVTFEMFFFVCLLVFCCSKRHHLTSWNFLAELEEFRLYLEKCFDFEQVTVKKFRTWAERRQFNRDMKRKQAESERPILPANQKLITLSVQDAPTKKGASTCDSYCVHFIQFGSRY